MKYIYIDKGGGLADPTGYATDGDQLVYVGFSSDGVKAPYNVPSGKIKLDKNLVLMSVKNFENLVNNKAKAMAKDYSQITGAPINSAETTTGSIVKYREETPSVSSPVQTLVITLDGSDMAANTSALVLIGDGARAAEYAGAGVTSQANGDITGGPIVRGNFGVQTLNWLRNMCANGTIILQEMQLTSSGTNPTTYFSKGVVAKMLSVNPEASVQESNINMDITQDGSQFQQNVRRFADFKYTLSNRTALRFLIESGDILTMNFKIRAVSDVYGMRLVSQK